DDDADPGREAEKIIISNTIDWDGLYLRADLHSVRPQLAKLLNMVAGDLVPAEFREKLNKRYQANLLDQIGYAAGFLEVRQILDKLGIRLPLFWRFLIRNRTTHSTTII
ncbi:MAG: nucleotidyltransferase family protein, partial [Syntrophaceae bacterium]|nr:nucleotidyltransferase family protein [Syntrophaceae bacterium]